MLARRFTIVCLLTTLFGMVFAILVARQQAARSARLRRSRALPSDAIKPAVRRRELSAPRQGKMHEHAPPDSTDPDSCGSCRGHCSSLVVAAPVMAISAIRAADSTIIEAPAHEEPRRRLRAAGQPAARLSRGGAGRALAAAPSRRPLQVSIMGHGKANLPGTHRIGRLARALSSGKASPMPRRPSRRCKQLYDRNTEFLRDSFAALGERRRHRQALPRLLSRGRRHDHRPTARSIRARPTATCRRPATSRPRSPGRTCSRAI